MLDDEHDRFAVFFNGLLAAWAAKNGYGSANIDCKIASVWMVGGLKWTIISLFF